MKQTAVALLTGTIFSLLFLANPPANAATETVIYSFTNYGVDGANPHSALIDENGTLYGTTFFGGLGQFSDQGTLFSVDPTTGAETALYTFEGGTDGRNPSAPVIDVNDTLYGTTVVGGAGGNADCCGTVFAFNLSAGTETVLHAFKGGADGASPYDGLIDIKGKLYGTTLAGGGGGCANVLGDGCGTVFSVDPKTGAEKVLYAFQYGTSDGQNPYAGLIDVNGKLYGTTFTGGSHTFCIAIAIGCGTIFAIDPATGAEHVVYSFRGGTHGGNPQAGLIYVNGKLYGTTSFGGDVEDCTNYDPGCGTVFAFNLSTGAEKVLYAIPPPGVPTAGLLYVNGLLYGTTSAGSSCCGTVFSVNPKTGAGTLIYSFCQHGCADGEVPTSELIDVKGKLYSTTWSGGANGGGTVFSITTLEPPRRKSGAGAPGYRQGVLGESPLR